MSTLIVENLKGPTTGSNANTITIPSGQTIDASAGTLVPSSGQVVQAVSNDTLPTTLASYSTNNTYAASNIEVSITPKSSSNKMLIVCDFQLDPATGYNFAWAIYKDGTMLSPSSPSTGANNADGHGYMNRLSGGPRILMHQSVMATDASVGTTNAVNYELYVKPFNGLVYLRNDLCTPRMFIWEIAQ